MIVKHYLQQYCSKAVIAAVVIATSWYLVHLYNAAYAPLFINPPSNVVTNSQYNIPQDKINSVLQIMADKSIGSVDFSEVTTPISAKASAKAETMETTDAPTSTIGSEGITVSEAAP